MTALPDAPPRNRGLGVTARSKGRDTPRLAPPLPARSRLAEFEATAKGCGIELYPWQRTAARYLTAIGPRDLWLYPEVAIIVARQNGKTRMLVPLVTERILSGQRVMHTAQNREIPREVFGEVADLIESQHADLLPKRNGRTVAPRFANGQEEIRLTTGGLYRIVAPTRGGARGPSNDLVIVDELREMNDHDFIAAAKPTLTASRNPQIVYLSNAGTEDSVVLNALKKRAEADHRLAYLEWSAAPERKADDRLGWLEANPSIGHNAAQLAYLEGEYNTNLLADTMAIFETEHLCRWVQTLLPPFVDPGLWPIARGPLTVPMRPVMGIALDPSGMRASAAIAWQQTDGTIGTRLIADATGNLETGEPVQVDQLLGPQLVAAARRAGVIRVVYDPYDAHLARHFRKPEPMNGRDFANACGAFVRVLEGHHLRWQDAEAVGGDLTWTTRRQVGPGAFMAVKAKEDHPITAALATIRAVGAACGPRPVAHGGVY